MKRFLPLVALGALALTGCSEQLEPTAPDLEPAFAQASSSADPFVRGRVLARFNPGAPAAAVAAREGASIQREVTLGIMMLSVPAGAELRVAQALSRNPNVEFAEPDYIRTFGDPAVMPVNDPFIGYKWDLDNDGTLYTSTGDFVASSGSPDADMDWREAYEHLGGTAGSAVVGIMDTGIRADHEDLVGRIQAQHDFFAGDSNAADDDGHGTHVAGIVAAAADNAKGVSGVAFGDVRFVIAKVCGPSSRGGPFGGYGCPLSAIAEGITWAVDNGANVLNLSLGGTSGSSAEQTALQYARSNGVLPFCATGNENTSVSYPAAFPECVAVGATDWNDERASYSNFGPEVVLSAPGGDDEDPNGYSYILSSYFDSPTSYAFMAGTSMATPQAVGLGALLHAIGFTDDDAKLDRMIATADDLGPAGRDNQFGYGRINAYGAVSGSTPPPPDENQAPSASFTFSCDELACSFDGSASSDADGSIAGYAWSFGDGTSGSGAGAAHTYASGGTYSVTLTVTDDDGATDAQTQSVSVSASSGGSISLSASGYKVRGVHHVDLTWSGAASSSVDVVRNGSTVATTANDGAHTDNTGAKGGGSYSYTVCEAGTSTCSNSVTVAF